MTRGRRRGVERRLAAQLALLAAAMFGFGFLLVPLYAVFCEITGLGGRTATTPATAAERPDESRLLRVEFLASVGRHGPFHFHPTVSHLEVHPGKLYRATFVARNLTPRPLVGHATPSVAPGRAARFFRKTECFCFTPQPFAAGEDRELTVAFIIDPDMPRHVDTVTLSYTLYASDQLAQL